MNVPPGRRCWAEAPLERGMPDVPTSIPAKPDVRALRMAAERFNALKRYRVEGAAIRPPGQGERW